MKYRPIQSNRLLWIACACVLTVTGAWGCIHGIRAAWAQKLYKQSKYGHFLETRFEVPPVEDAAQVLRDCEFAQRLYPRNYYFPVLASIRSLEVALEADNLDDFERDIRNSTHWNRIALSLHPNQIEALEAKCRLLQEQGKHKEAIEFWREKVLEREYWNPDRWNIYAELCLKAGEETRAIEAVSFLQGETLQKVRLLDRRRKAMREKGMDIKK